MWKIQHIVVFVICTVTGFLFFPISLIFSVLCVVLTGLVYFCGLPLSVHVASIRLWIESSYASAVNLFHQSNQTLPHQHRQLHSNGIVKNHSLIFTDKLRSSPNLISRNPLCNEQKLPDSFIMPLNNCGLHSTPLGLSKNEFDKQRKRLEVEERCSPSWCDKDRDAAFSPKSVPRNVQSVAGPLLVSTRFNTSLNAELTADVSSMGFSSRVAQKGAVRDGVTHQPKYSGVGVFPLVQLNSRSPKHSLSPRNCNAASKAVRVRIAPPDNGPFGGLENTILCTSTDGDESMKSVLQVLKEMSRKRIHSQVDEEEDDKVKRQKKENYDENTPKVCLDGGLQNKRGRDDSPRSSEEVKRQRRLTNATAGSNEIMSSLSSSLAVKPPHLMKGTKRKAHAVDWSRSTTPVSGKLLKVNVSPVTRISPPTSAALIEEEHSGQKSFKDTDNEIAVSNKPVEENEQKQSSAKTSSVEKNNAVAVEPSSECVRIEAGKRRVLARTGDLKEVPVQDIRWQESDTDTGGYVDESTPTISVQKIKDPGRRLKDMLAAIDGSDEIDADPTSMSPSVIAILKTAKPSSKQKSTSILNSPDLLQSPKSILKTIGKNESHKTVTFADQVDVENKNTAAVDLGSTSPQTCLTTATIVSNSINTSISSASETTSFQFGGSGSTFKNADSNLTFSASSPTAISPVSTASATTVASTPQQESQIKSPFGSVTAFGGTETKSTPPINFFNTASPISTASNTGKVSDSLAVTLGNNNSGTSTGFSFGTSIKSNEGLSSNPSAASGLLGVNSEQNKATPGLFGFSSVANINSPPNSSSLSIAPVSVSGSSTNNTFALNPSTQPFDLNASKLPSTGVATKISGGENAQKPQFGMFNFGNSPSNNSNDNKSSGSIFGGLGSPSTIAPAASQSSSTMSQSTAPSFMMPSITTAAAPSNSMFSFGANSASSNQAPNIFGSGSSQPATHQSLFGGTSGNTALQTAATSTSVSSSTQPNIFSNVNANTQLTVFGGSATQPNLSSPAVTNAVAVNSAPVFGNVQPAISSTGATPTFGSGGLFNGIPNKTEGFGSPGVFGSSTVPASGVDSTPSLFNSFSSPAQSGSFGSKPSATVNAFPTNPVVTTSTPVFGQQASTSGSLFQFSSSPAQTTPSSLFGNNANPVNAAAPVNGPSTFGVFSKANNSTSDADKAKSSPFGGNVSTSGSSFQPGVFSFGSSALSSNSNFAFSNATNTAATTTASSVFNSPFKPPTNEPKPFGFDAAPQPAIQSQGPVFAFGQSNNNSNSSQPAAPSFQFNANANNNNNTAQQPASSGIFSFGAATNSPFGSGINPPTFNIGGGETPSGSAMFSIGSGSSSARPRTAARPRRTK